MNTLTGITPPRNASHPTSLAKAMEYIRKQFSGHGHHVKIQPITVAGETYHNVIASIGPDSQSRVIVGAHYDVCGDQPGADDNASGIAVLLELSRLLSEADLHRRVDLVAFTLEEPPYFRTRSMGSAVHADSLKEDCVAVEVMISIDMVGYFSHEEPNQMLLTKLAPKNLQNRINTISVVGSEVQRELVEAIAASLRSGSSLKVVCITAPRGTPGLDFSDHLNYWKLGMPAVLITNFPITGNPYYHSIGDTPDRLDFPRMVEVVRSVYWLIVHLGL